MNTVYVDVSFAINFLMDYIILWASGRITHGRIRHRRLALAAALGAIYAVGQLFAPAMLYTGPVKVMISLLMLRIAFTPVNKSDFVKKLACFYAISIFAGGVSVATAYLSLGTPWIKDWLPLALLLAVLSAILIGTQGERWLLHKVAPALLNYPIRIQIEGRFCEGAALLDTGNGLLDPLSRRPVVVAEYGWLRECLPTELAAVMQESQDAEGMAQVIGASVWAHRLRMIPFSSVGRHHGMMAGLRCDHLTIGSGAQQISHQDLVIAIYPERLSADNAYQALIPFGVLREKT
ncbi:MAG: sigma-E processing peptidase SpoIIGA [Syntrophomonadaceae bacterium]|nr:sigma-E processing peptidase SpoIIGA [Syntrophomonadaceae bacterium]